MPEVHEPVLEQAEDKGWSKDACDLWIAGFGGTAPGGQIGKALKPLVTKHGWRRVRRPWQVYCLQRDIRFASASDFATKWFGLLDAMAEAGDEVKLPVWAQEPKRMFGGGWSDGIER